MRLIGSSVTAALLAAATASAQEAASVPPAATVSTQEAPSAPGNRHGFWTTIGGGWVVARGTCNICGADPPYRNRAGLYVAMGGVISPHVLASGEVFTQSGTLNQGELGQNHVRVTYVTSQLHWYPRSAPVYIKFGFGFSRGQNTFVRQGEERKESTTGVGIMFGLGADIPLGRKFSLSPVASWYMGAVGDFQTAAGLARSVSSNTWMAAMGLTLN